MGTDMEVDDIIEIKNTKNTQQSDNEKSVCTENANEMRYALF